MGSKTYSGVLFQSYADDHLPPHVHRFYSGAEVIVDLLPGGKVRKSSRKDSVRPVTAKRGDVRRILSMAAANAAELHGIWEKMHGSAS